MKIAVLGGTGSMGAGLILRLAHKHKMMVCSRDIEKAKELVKEYTRILKGCQVCFDEIEARENNNIKDADIIVIALPFQSVEQTLNGLEDILMNKIVITTVVPMINKDGKFYYDIPLRYQSFANAIQDILPNSKVVAAFQNIPASRLSDITRIMDDDVIVCGNDENAKKIVRKLYDDMFRSCGISYDGGELANSAFVDAITPFLINIAIRNKTKPLGIYLTQ